jgi:hypothetical protein
MSITPKMLVFRLQGRSDEYYLTIGQAFQRAVSLASGVDLGARDSTRIKRGLT